MQKKFVLRSYESTLLTSEHVLADIQELWERHPTAGFGFEVGFAYHIGDVINLEEDCWMKFELTARLLTELPLAPPETLGQRIARVSDQHGGAGLLEEYLRELGFVRLWKLENAVVM